MLLNYFVHHFFVRWFTQKHRTPKFVSLVWHIENMPSKFWLFLNKFTNKCVSNQNLRGIYFWWHSNEDEAGLILRWKKRKISCINLQWISLKHTLIWRVRRWIDVLSSNHRYPWKKIGDLHWKTASNNKHMSVFVSHLKGDGKSYVTTLMR